MTNKKKSTAASGKDSPEKQKIMAQKNGILRFMNRIEKVYQLFKDGYSKILFSEFLKRLYSESISFGLQRDLNRPFEAPDAKINIGIRPLSNTDLDRLLENTGQRPVDPFLVANRRAMADNLPGCYVAVTREDDPCYMQWLIGFKDNDKIRAHFGDTFPPLKKNEALLEGAYSSPSYRGLGIMPAAMAQIAEKGHTENSRWINTFVDVTNIPSLKGCRRSGFEPYMIRKDRWFLFKRSVSFHALPPELLEKFYTATGKKPEMPTSLAGKQEENTNHIPQPIKQD